MSLTDRIQRTIRQDVQSMHAYAIQPSAGLVKLDAMENPFRLPAALQRELGERLGAVAINRYPASCVADVVAALSKHVELSAGCRLMLGNGSDELISLLAMACDVPGNTILAPLPGFVMYEMSAKLQGLKFAGVPLTANFELDEAAMMDGAGAWRIYWKIMLPLSIPVLVTAAIFTFIWTWDDFFGPLIYLNRMQDYTVMLGLRTFVDSTGESDFGGLFAMSVLSIVPIFVFFLLFQRLLIEGIATTGMKR